MADGLAYLGSQGTCLGPLWMKDALTKVHRKVIESGVSDPRPEHTLMQHAGWAGFREIMVGAAEKVIGRGKQPVVGLPYSEETLGEIRRRRNILDEKTEWMRSAVGLDEIKRRKNELNWLRSDFNACRWRARTEWANKKILDLKKGAEEAHDLGAIYQILRETGLSVEKTFSAKGREFCLVEHSCRTP